MGNIEKLKTELIFLRKFRQENLINAKAHETDYIKNLKFLLKRILKLPRRDWETISEVYNILIITVLILSRPLTTLLGKCANYVKGQSTKKNNLNDK